MRTTVNLDDDVLAAARSIARVEGRPVGTVLSELVRRGLAPSEACFGTEKGFPVVRVSPDAPPITDEMVKAALDE